MLGKKRGGKGPLLKHKSTEEKLSSINPKKQKKNDDESIESNSDIESEKSDIQKENKYDKKVPTTKKIENIDEKRARLAKALLSKIDSSQKEEDESEGESDSDNDDTEHLNKILQKKISAEASAKHVSYFSNDKFNPHEHSFIKAHKSSITSLDISSDNSFVITSSKDTRGILIDLNTNKKTLLPQFTQKALNCVALSTNNKTAYFGGKDKFIYQIDLTSHSIIQKIKAHNEAVTGILVDLNKEQFYSVGNDHLLKVWSSETNQSVQLETFYGHTAKVNTITTIPGDVTRIITSGMDNFINLWKVDSQSFLQYKYNEIYPVDCLAGLNGGVFISGDFNGKVAGWRTGKKKPVCEIEYAHGYQKNFEVKHTFFSGFDETKKGSDIEIGNPILSMGCIKYSDLIFTGSNKGSINLYKVSEEDKKNKLNVEKKNTIEIKNSGCVNSMKESRNGDFIVCGNGCDGKNGRWDWDYDSNIGISVIKLFQ